MKKIRLTGAGSVKNLLIQFKTFLMIKSAKRLQTVLEEVPSRLSRISEEKSTHRRAAGKWSKKEELGHLVDSAANNHQRFVRLQIAGDIPLWHYEQQKWVEIQHYDAIAWSDIVNLWEVYNRHLLHIMKTLDESKLSHKGHYPESGMVTLQFLLDDYVDHLEHHLKVILS